MWAGAKFAQTLKTGLQCKDIRQFRARVIVRYVTGFSLRGDYAPTTKVDSECSTTSTRPRRGEKAPNVPAHTTRIHN